MYKIVDRVSGVQLLRSHGSSPKVWTQDKETLVKLMET